ncbi:MAG: TetR family transcriptional regulator [Polyangiales bacterium]
MDASQVRDGDGAVERPGLRARKAAATRLALTRALNARLVARSLGEISVDELAEDAGVSRVTFFNYFPSKEAALETVLIVWLYESQCAAVARGRRGLAGIEAMYRTMGTFVQEAPLRARQLLAWFVAMPADRALPALTQADREAIAGEGAPTPVPASLGEILMRHLAEAREAGEINPDESDYELAHLLGALLIGGCLVGHSRPRQDWERLYRNHLRRVLDPLRVAKDAPRRRGSP